MRKIVVIPTYNEKENLAAIVTEVLRVDPAICVLVVDDNSPDGTGTIADAMSAADSRVQVLHRPGKDGLGIAYRDGLSKAVQMGGDLIVQMDADFSHPPSALPGFFDLARDYDLVLGSRYIDGITVVNWPMLRLMLSYFGNEYARRVLGGLPVMDATGGFKCWRRSALEAISLEDVRANGYCFQVETTFRAWRAGLSIKETPILFVDRRLGTSKMHLSIAVEAMLIVWKLRWMALTGKIRKAGKLAGPGGTAGRAPEIS